MSLFNNFIQVFDKFGRGRSQSQLVESSQATQLLNDVDDMLDESYKMLMSIKAKIPDREFQSYEHDHNQLYVMVVDVKSDIRGREKNQVFFASAAERDAFYIRMRKLLERCEVHHTDVLSASRKAYLQTTGQAIEPEPTPPTTLSTKQGSDSETEWLSIVKESDPSAESVDNDNDLASLSQYGSESSNSSQQFIATVVHIPKSALATEEELKSQLPDDDSYCSRQNVSHGGVKCRDWFLAKITSYFSRATPEQAAEQASRQFELIRHEIRVKKAQRALKEADKSRQRTQDGTQRQRRRRQRIKENEVQLGLRNPVTLRKIKVMQLRQASESPDTVIPSNSRAKRTNPYEPTRWAIIEASRKRVGLKSPQALVTDLRKGPSGALFKTLDRGTVKRWINKGATDWTPEVYARVALAEKVHKALRSQLVVQEGKKVGRPARLDRYPGLANKIVDVLKGIRLAGTVITRALAQSIAIAYIRTEAPALFNNPSFKCSDSFVRRFLREKLDWKWRSATQTAQKLPLNWEDLCVDMAQRVTWTIMINDVPPELIINADQTGISYLGTGRQTWELRGSKQVPTIGNDEKRQFTLMVAVTASGEVLPFQAIYKGLSEASLPSRHSRREGERMRFLFSIGGKKHWASIKTLEDWIDDLVECHIDEVIARLNLPPGQKAILIIDCWSVHRGQEFLDWMRAKHPRIIILFIPGGCTGVAQPCDMAINRALKHFIKSECVKYLARVTSDQLARGISPSQIYVDTTPGTLRDASTAWLTSAWIWLRNQPELVLSAWRQAEFKGLNLSYECLTSPMSRSMARERYSEDPSFILSVSIPVVPSEPGFDENPEGVDYDDDYAIDPAALACLRLDASAPSQIIEADGSIVYIGDEYDSDSEDIEVDFD